MGPNFPHDNLLQELKKGAFTQQLLYDVVTTLLVQICERIQGRIHKGVQNIFCELFLLIIVASNVGSGLFLSQNQFWDSLDTNWMSYKSIQF